MTMPSNESLTLWRWLQQHEGIWSSTVIAFAADVPTSIARHRLRELARSGHVELHAPAHDLAHPWTATALRYAVTGCCTVPRGITVAEAQA